MEREEFRRLSGGALIDSRGILVAIAVGALDGLTKEIPSGQQTYVSCDFGFSHSVVAGTPHTGLGLMDRMPMSMVSPGATGTYIRVAVTPPSDIATVHVTEAGAPPIENSPSKSDWVLAEVPCTCTVTCVSGCSTPLMHVDSAPTMVPAIELGAQQPLAVALYTLARQATHGVGVVDGLGGRGPYEA